MGSPETTPKPNIYDVLERIRVDVEATKVSVAMVAAENPYIVAQGKDHEHRLRILERDANRVAWLPRVATYLGTIAGGGIIGFFISYLTGQ